MLTWTPTNDTALLETDEEAVNISLSIDVTSAGGDAVITNYLFDQPGNTFDVTVNGDNITLTAANLAGLYEIIHIQYLLNGVVETCYDWNDIPNESDQIISYRKDPTSPRIFTLEITAEGTDETLTLETETVSYELIITANYTGGKLALLAAIDKRR